MTLGTRIRHETIYQVTIQLNCMQIINLFEQRPGQGSQAGTNFHDMLARLRIEAPDNAVDNTLVMQEILTKALACNVFHLYVPLCAGHGDGHLQCFKQAASVNLASAGKRQGGTMIDRGADKWQAECDVDCLTKAGML